MKYGMFIRNKKKTDKTSDCHDSDFKKAMHWMGCCSDLYFKKGDVFKVISIVDDRHIKVKLECGETLYVPKCLIVELTKKQYISLGGKHVDKYIHPELKEVLDNGNWGCQKDSVKNAFEVISKLLKDK